MFGLKKRKKAADVATPAAMTLADADVRHISVDWDDATRILTVSDFITGDVIAASHGDTVIVAARVPAVRGIHISGADTTATLEGAMAALKRVGITQVISHRPGMPPSFIG